MQGIVRRLRWFAVGVALVASAAGAALVLADVASPIRAACALVFLLVLPGLAAAGAARGRDLQSALVIGTATSVVVNTATAAGMLAFDAWSPQVGVIVVAAVSGFLWAMGALSPSVKARTATADVESR
ncbi:hypothetical protein [Rhizohabitans arisaemae]|uniref:hypothetical protein n=1 Tax=Rhizohabitans arisaemae TaxID=2720610 RepID=UPI0024B11BF5|nr:hypothetical protein [Rhizohabitans arisaemae]